MYIHKLQINHPSRLHVMYLETSTTGIIYALVCVLPTSLSEHLDYLCSKLFIAASICPGPKAVFSKQGLHSPLSLAPL